MPERDMNKLIKNVSGRIIFDSSAGLIFIVKSIRGAVTGMILYKIYLSIRAAVTGIILYKKLYNIYLSFDFKDYSFLNLNILIERLCKDLAFEI